MEQITDDAGDLVASFHDEILLTTDKNKGEENLHFTTLGNRFTANDKWLDRQPVQKIKLAEARG